MKRRFGVVVVVAGLGLSLTGCLGDAKEKASGAGQTVRLTAAQVLGRTADKADQVTSLTADMEIDSKLSQGATTMKMRMEMQFKPKLQMRMVTQPSQAAGTTVPGMEMLMTEDALYMKATGPMKQMTGGKPWGRMSLDALSAQSGMNMRSLMEQSKQSNPVEQVKLLTASKDVREVGAETVDGVQARKYSGTITLSEAVGKVDADTRAAMEKQYKQLGAETMTFDLWVDDAGLPRKMVGTIDTPTGKVATTVTYKDFNKPLSVQVPDPSQYGDMKMP